MTTGSGVSFVVPVYNKAAYLPDVLATIRAQRGDSARQYIFVDDGSTDDSLAILERLTAGWPNTVVVSQENLGSAHAANRGIALAVQHGDNGTRHLLEQMLTSEEDHVDWLETQLGLVESLGEQLYLSEQLHA